MSARCPASIALPVLVLNFCGSNALWPEATGQTSLPSIDCCSLCRLLCFLSCCFHTKTSWGSHFSVCTFSFVSCKAFLLMETPVSHSVADEPQNSWNPSNLEGSHPTAQTRKSFSHSEEAVSVYYDTSASIMTGCHAERGWLLLLRTLELGQRFRDSRRDALKANQQTEWKESPLLPLWDWPHGHDW